MVSRKEINRFVEAAPDGPERQLELARINWLLIAILEHTVSPKFRLGGEAHTGFTAKPYRIDLIAAEACPELVPEHPDDHWYLIRISCSHPFYCQRDVRLMLAAVPGAANVRYVPFLKGEPRHHVWRHKDRDSLCFGFEASIDLSDRCKLLADLRRLQGGRA